MNKTELDRQQEEGSKAYAEMRRKADLWDFFMQKMPCHAADVLKLKGESHEGLYNDTVAFACILALLFAFLIRGEI